MTPRNSPPVHVKFLLKQQQRTSVYDYDGSRAQHTIRKHGYQ